MRAAVAAVAADAGEAMLQDAAGKDRVGDLRHDGAPRAALARQALVVDRLQAVRYCRIHQNESAMPRNRMNMPLDVARGSSGVPPPNAT